MRGQAAIWLGHRRTGGRLCLGTDQITPGIVVLGAGADHLASVLAVACSESGQRVLVLDLDGRIEEQIAGRFDAKGLGYFLYDSQRMEEKSSLHAELSASAFTMSLNLNYEQEGFLNSAIQYIGLEQGLASPSSLVDRLAATGEFRGHTADELRGKLGALRSLNLVGDAGVVRDMIERNTVASFAEAESHQAAEVAAMLLVAKILALGASGSTLPDILVLNEANRVFVSLPLSRHTNKLLTALLSVRMSRIFVSEVIYELDNHIFDTSPVAILSSSFSNEASGLGSSSGRLSHGWHRDKIGSEPSSRLLFTPNMFLLHDAARGYQETFIARSLVPVQVKPAPVVQPTKDDSRLVKRILEILSTYDHATRGSVVGFLSAEDPPEDVQKSIDRLHDEGYLAVVGKDVKKDSPLQTFRLTEKGYALLRGLT